MINITSALKGAVKHEQRYPGKKCQDESQYRFTKAQLNTYIQNHQRLMDHGGYVGKTVFVLFEQKVNYAIFQADVRYHDLAGTGQPHYMKVNL